MIYLDNAATTSMDPEIITSLQDYMRVQFANSGTVYGIGICLLYTSPSPRDATLSRMPSSA